MILACQQQYSLHYIEAAPEIEHARVEQYAEAYDHLKIQFAKLQRQHFGSKSERYIEDQLPLFGDLSTPEDQVRPASPATF